MNNIITLSTTTFNKLKVGDAFKFESYSPYFVKAKGGFREGCGGQLHACQPTVKVFKLSFTQQQD